MDEREKETIAILEKLLDKEYVSRWTIFAYRKELRKFIQNENRYAQLETKVENEIEYAIDSL